MRKSSFAPAAAVAVALALTVAMADLSEAVAQPASGAAETDRARELHRAGDAAFRAGKFEEARTAYLAAWALKKHWQIATNLGDCELRTGRHRDAAEHLTYGLREGGTTMPAEQRDGVRKALEEAKRHVAELQLAVTPDGADVTVDGEFTGKSPLADPLFLSSGQHTIEVKKVGFTAKSTPVTSQAGATTSLRIALEEQPSGVHQPPSTPRSSTPPPTQPPEEPDDTGGGKSVPILVGGVALAATGIGLGIGMLVGSSSAASDRDALVADLPGSNACAPGSPLAACDEIASLDSDAGTFGAVGAVALGIGATAAIATLVYALWPTDGESSAMVVPIVSPDGAGLLLRSPL